MSSFLQYLNGTNFRARENIFFAHHVKVARIKFRASSNFYLFFHLFTFAFSQKGNYNRGNKLSEQMRKTALCLTPQAMYNQFKRHSAASVSELYYICRKT